MTWGISLLRRESERAIERAREREREGESWLRDESTGRGGG